MAKPRGKIESLPKWAQQRIEALQRDVEYWRGRWNEGPEDSNTFSVHGFGGDSKPLGNSPDIEFVPPSAPLQHFKSTLDARLESDGRVRVSSTYGGIVVEPGASNVVYISARRL